MKKLFLIGGTMGIGKTAVCQILKKKLKNAVFLDGDWCWNSDPFKVTEETKSMVMKNICFLLNNFLRCSEFDNIIFCWVMHEQNIIDNILKAIDSSGHEIKIISLMCDEDELKSRLLGDVEKGIRSFDIIEKSIERLRCYTKLKTIKINTSEKKPDEVATEIIKDKN